MRISRVRRRLSSTFKIPRIFQCADHHHDHCDSLLGEALHGATVALSFFSPVALGFSVVASLLKWICFCNGQNMILFRVTDMQESTPCCSE
jgi:hypothetical protein